MKQTLMFFAFAIAFVLTANGQNETSMNALLAPSATNFSDAKNQGVEVFRLLPRGMFDETQNELSLRGGGAYYSFVKKSYSYDEIPQIQLENNNLSVGFAGANYGMIADLGETPLSEIDSKNKSVNSLYNYRTKNLESEARVEHRKLHSGIEINGLKFKRNLEANVGHTYILRAINFGDADTLVAFNVKSKDDDGSLTIYWKLIKNFEKPILVRDTVKPSTEQIIAEVQKELITKGYTGVVVTASEKLIVLRGNVPKDKMVDVLQTAMEVSGRNVKNELILK